MDPFLHDMHCHLDFMANGQDVAADALAAGTLVFANTVTPAGWLAAHEQYAAFPNVTVGFGMHPWWVGENAGAQETANEQGVSGLRGGDAQDADSLAAADGRGDDTATRNCADKAQNQARSQQRQLSQRAEHRRQVEQSAMHETADSEEAAAQRKHVIELLERHKPRIVGEIGLDLSWRHAHTRAEQLRMFEAIADWAAQSGGKLLSLHSIKSAQETIDILDQAGAFATCTCIFHWFTGPSDLLHRAIKSGCYFSCGPRMLATGKGREYVKAIPVERLLLETDAPPARGTDYSFEEMHAELESVANSIAAIKGESALEVIAETSARLLG